MTQWLPGMRITADRLNDGLDPTTVTTGLVAATGFSVADFEARRLGSRLVSFTATLLNVSSTALMSGTNNGNIAGDPVIATLPSGWGPNEVVAAVWDNGTVFGGAVIGTGGGISLRTITYNQAVGTGTNIRVAGTYITP